MKLCDFGGNIYLGQQKKEYRYTNNNELFTYKLLTQNSIRNRFINPDFLEEYDSIVKLDDKYLTKKGDIIVCSKQPYNVVLINDETEENIYITNNFVILRNLKIDSYYLYNYLNLLGFNMKFDKEDENKNITKTDIEQLEININKDMLDKVSELCSRINIRQKSYGKLLDNDEQLIKLIFEKSGCDFDD